MMSMQLSAGTSLQNGKYRIEKVLGQGGFGITYLAEQQFLERKVCIKEFFMRDFCNRSESNYSVTLGTAANKDLLERYRNKFIKEARTIATLDYPNIIHIHDIFQENDTAYYVMDYIEGESLSEMVKRRGILPEQEAVNYICAIGDALRYIHQRNINHLDVKPGNIMVRRADSRVFLLDFGLSKQYDAIGNQTSSTPLGISHGFAPIEQYSPEGIKEFSPQTDIYSLGATLYYLITGTTPPPASELFASELEGFPSTVSASVKEAVGQAMKPQKKERPQSVDDFLKLLPQSGQTVSSVQTAFQESVKTEQTTSAAEEETFLCHQEKKTIISLYEKPAEQGDANAQYCLGTCYYDGYGISPDFSKAVEWYRKSAEQGYADAQYKLGICYENGDGVSQDFSKAVEWYRKSAEQGHAYAQHYLGNCYYHGKGVSQDFSKALEWYQKAANQDILGSRMRVAEMKKSKFRKFIEKIFE